MAIFEYGLDSPQLGTLLFSAVAAFIYLFMVKRPASPRRSAVKTLAVGLLAALSVVVDGPVFLTAALIACAVGDALLAQEDKRFFLAGLIAILIGHVLYIVLFNGLGTIETVVEEPVRLAVGAAMVIAAMLATLRIVPAAGSLGPLIGAYIAVIVAMGLSSLLMSGWGVVAGALCFMASDLVLAMRKFPPPQTEAPPPNSHFVWVSYYFAQVLITLSVLGLA